MDPVVGPKVDKDINKKDTTLYFYSIYCSKCYLAVRQDKEKKRIQIQIDTLMFMN